MAAQDGAVMTHKRIWSLDQGNADIVTQPRNHVSPRSVSLSFNRLLFTLALVVFPSFGHLRCGLLSWQLAFLEAPSFTHRSPSFSIYQATTARHSFVGIRDTAVSERRKIPACMEPTVCVFCLCVRETDSEQNTQVTFEGH